MWPSEIPKLPTDLLVRAFPGVWKLLLLHDSLPRTETWPGKGVVKEEMFPNTRKPSLVDLWGALESQRAT